MSPSADRPDASGVRVPPPLLFAAGFAVGWLLHRFWPVRLLPADAAWRLVPAVLFVMAGAGLGLWGVFTFHRARTTIWPHLPAARIVEHGPYRFTRNPMYAGLTLAYAGFTLWLGSLWPLVLLPLVLVALTHLVIRREEAYLRRAFGAEYEAYCTRVRRWV